MSNVIDFLERLGQDAQLRHATGIELEQALTRAGIEPVGASCQPRRLAVVSNGWVHADW